MSETPLRVVPLGGLGEIGKNMMALEYDGEMVVIDAGVLFPEEGMPGVDLVIPDITYLVENRHKLKAILITHGHEDHIGALPYVLPELDVPIYSSRLTHGLVSVKLRERGLLKDARLNVVEPNTPFKVGRLGVEFFRVCHSIPDAMGIAIRTPLGVVVHTGDFKIDHTPADGRPSELGPLARFGDEGVLLMCSDSTYAEIEGFTPSEQVVGDALDRVISRAKGRVMIATFASLISRIQQVIDAAVRHGRKVGVVGRSMNNNVRMATNMGYLQAPPGTVMSLNDAQDLPLDEVVILATGAQGEPTSALVQDRQPRAPGHRDRARRYGGHFRFTDSRKRDPGGPDLRQSRPAGRHRVAQPHSHGPRARPRQPRRAEDGAQPREATVFRPCPRRVQAPRRPCRPGPRDGGS